MSLRITFTSSSDASATARGSISALALFHRTRDNPKTETAPYVFFPMGGVSMVRYAPSPHLQHLNDQPLGGQVEDELRNPIDGIQKEGRVGLDALRAAWASANGAVRSICFGHTDDSGIRILKRILDPHGIPNPCKVIQAI